VAHASDGAGLEHHVSDVVVRLEALCQTPTESQSVAALPESGKRSVKKGRQAPRGQGLDSRIATVPFLSSYANMSPSCSSVSGAAILILTFNPIIADTSPIFLFVQDASTRE